MDFNDRRPGKGQMSFFGPPVKEDPSPQEEVPVHAGYTEKPEPVPERPFVSTYSPGNPTYDNNHRSPSSRLPMDLPPPVTVWDRAAAAKKSSTRRTHFDQHGNPIEHGTSR